MILTNHTHEYRDVYLEESAGSLDSVERPRWAKLYTGDKRWLQMRKCKCGKSIAVNVVHFLPENAEVIKRA